LLGRLGGRSHAFSLTLLEQRWGLMPALLRVVRWDFFCLSGKGKARNSGIRVLASKDGLGTIIPIIATTIIMKMMDTDIHIMVIDTDMSIRTDTEDIMAGIMSSHDTCPPLAHMARGCAGTEADVRKGILRRLFLQRCEDRRRFYFGTIHNDVYGSEISYRS